jgi:hypothetical protein
LKELKARFLDFAALGASMGAVAFKRLLKARFLDFAVWRCVRGTERDSAARLSATSRGETLIMIAPE